MMTVLSAHMFERTLSDFLNSRFEFELNDLRQRIETQVDLGIELGELQNVPSELEAYMHADNQILTIEVFDETGTVLFSTDPSFVGDLVTEEWVTAWRAGPRSGCLVQPRARRSRGRCAVARQPGAGGRLPGPALLPRLLRRQCSCAIDAPVVHRCGRSAGHGPLTVLGAMVLLRGLRGELRDLSESMDDVAKRRRDGPALGRTRPDHPELAAFAAVALTAHDDIDAAIGEIRRLDEEEAV